MSTSTKLTIFSMALLAFLVIGSIGANAYSWYGYRSYSAYPYYGYYGGSYGGYTSGYSWPYQRYNPYIYDRTLMHFEQDSLSNLHVTSMRDFYRYDRNRYFY